MPGPTSLLAWVATALGTGAAGTVFSGWFNRRKTAADTVKTTAEARKIDAETAATRAETAEHVVEMLRAELDRKAAAAEAELGRQAADLARLRTELDTVRRATEECERHRAEDRQALETVKAENAGMRVRIDELERDLHRRARTSTGDAR